jgi:hypothetical protein
MSTSNPELENFISPCIWRRGSVASHSSEDRTSSVRIPPGHKMLRIRGKNVKRRKFYLRISWKRSEICNVTGLSWIQDYGHPYKSLHLQKNMCEKSLAFFKLFRHPLLACTCLPTVWLFYTVLHSLHSLFCFAPPCLIVVTRRRTTFSCCFSIQFLLSVISPFSSCSMLQGCQMVHF